MKKSSLRRTYVILVVIALTLGGILTWQLLRDDHEAQVHFERDETHLIISNVADVPVALFRAGRSLADTSRNVRFDGKDVWLGPGNYFLMYEDAHRSLFVPVPLTGYQCGLDKDGSFAVTIRPTPREFPPLLLPELPQFEFIPGGSFLLGDRLNPRERHHVWLTGYFVAPFEVTNAEFREFLKDSAGYADAANWTASGTRWKSINRSCRA